MYMSKEESFDQYQAPNPKEGRKMSPLHE